MTRLQYGIANCNFGKTRSYRDMLGAKAGGFEIPASRMAKEADGADQPPLVFQVLPRGMRYSQASATSIDLFVCEVAEHSRFRIEVVAEASGHTLPASKIHNLPKYGLANSFRRSRFVSALVQKTHPKALIVQQHLPSAANIAMQIAEPVILQRHNFMRPPNRSKLWGIFSRARRARQLASLAGLTFVSEAVLAEFEQDWPRIGTPRCVIPNGIDFANWSSRTQRMKTVLIVGRATPEKGLIEAAEALVQILPLHPEWSATFVVSEPERWPEYFASLQSVLAPLGDRASLLVNRPFSEVKALNEAAAIALIPSKWREPFGRTCLEAHAGGAAVISAGSGGLREISGEHALYLPTVSGAAIYGALSALFDDDNLRFRLANAGSERVRRLFDIRRVAADLDDFCAEVIETRLSGKRIIS